MTENHSKEKDSIHIFDFFKIIYNGKGLLTAAVFIAIILGSIVVYIQPSETYQAKLTYSQNLKPVYASSNQVCQDFKNLFYSQSVFDNWKENDKKNNISFNDLWAKIASENGKEIYVKPNTKIKFKNLELIINSGEPDFINNILSYTRYVNKRLSNQYLLRSEKEMVIFTSLYTKYGIALSGENMKSYLLLDRFSSSIKKGILIFDIHHLPLIEAKNPPRIILIYSLSIFLGLIFGFLTIFVRHELKKYHKLS
tara:strand:+ start:173 stop:931 length:759 start_codon:yes stop_codon:yes gene_type:complete